MYPIRALLLAILMCALVVGFQWYWIQSQKLPHHSSESRLITPSLSPVMVVKVTSNKILLHDHEEWPLDSLKDQIEKYVDNNGSGECKYCKEIRDPKGSQHPKEAKVSIVVEHGVSYGRFTSVKNEVDAAYRNLRERFSRSYFQRSFDQLTGEQQYVVTRSYPKRIELHQVEPGWAAVSD